MRIDLYGQARSYLVLITPAKLRPWMKIMTNYLAYFGVEEWRDRGVEGHSFIAHKRSSAKFNSRTKLLMKHTRAQGKPA